MKFKLLATSLAVSLALTGCATQQSENTQTAQQQQTTKADERVFSQVLNRRA